MGGMIVLLLIGLMSAIFFLFIAMSIIIVIYLLIVYIFESIFIMKVLKNSRKKTYLLAWIPFYNKYLLGRIANKKVLGVMSALTGLTLTGMSIYFYINSIFDVKLFGFFLVLVLIDFIINIVISHRIFKKALVKYGDILTIISVLTLGLLRPIFLFAIRNKEQVLLKNRRDKIEMIMFDLDGTLWDVTNTTYESANEIAKKYNLEHEITIETIKSTMGCNIEESAKNYMPYLQPEERLKIMQEMCDYNSKRLSQVGGTLYPELENVLSELKKKYKLAIVSNCGANYIESFLESSKLEKYFGDFMAASKEGITKGQAIRRVMERNDIDKAIYVGDTLKDFEASKEAEIEFVHAKYGFGKNVESKLFINDIRELSSLMDNIDKYK